MTDYESENSLSNQITFLKEENDKLNLKFNKLNETYHELETTKIGYGLSNMVAQSSENTEYICNKLEQLNEFKNHLEGRLKPYNIINTQANSITKYRDHLELEYNERHKVLDEKIRLINFILRLKDSYLVNVETLGLNNSVNKKEILSLVEELKNFRNFYNNNNFRTAQIVEENKLLKATKQVNLHQILKTIYIDNENVISLTKALEVIY